MIDKKGFSEQDIRTKFITPALRQAGWDEMAQIRGEVHFTKGRLIVRGKMVSRGKAKRADHIVESKPNILMAPLGASPTLPSSAVWDCCGAAREAPHCSRNRLI